MSIYFIAQGNPFGKQRPRVTINGTYTPSKTIEYENYIKAVARDNTKIFYENEPLKVVIKAFYPIPKSKSKNIQKMMLDGLILPVVKPDIDNVVKSITDALNGVCYRDDSQIVELVAIKKYCIVPCVIVEIMPILT